MISHLAGLSPFRWSANSVRMLRPGPHRRRLGARNRSHSWRMFP